MTTEESNEDWAKEFLELEQEKSNDQTPRQVKKAVLGNRPDLFVTLLGAFLGGGMVAVIWFFAVNYGLFDTNWTALAMAGAIVFGARFGINKAGSLLLVVSMTTYIVGVLLLLTAIIYNQNASIRANPWAFKKIETILVDNYFNSFDDFMPFGAGALLILVLTTVFGRKRY